MSKYMASQFQNLHEILTSTFFPPKFEFLNSYTVESRKQVELILRYQVLELGLYLRL